MWARRSATEHHPASLRTSSSSSHSWPPLRIAVDAVDEGVDDAPQRRHRPSAPSSSGPIRTHEPVVEHVDLELEASAGTDGATVAAASASSSIRSTGRSSREPRPPRTSATTPAPRGPEGTVSRIVSVIETVAWRVGSRAAGRDARRLPRARLRLHSRRCRTPDLTLSTETSDGVARHPRRRRARPLDRRRLRRRARAVARRRSRVVVELVRVHVHRLVGAAGARPRPAARRRGRRRARRSSRRRSRRDGCSSRGARPVHPGLRDARRGRHLSRLRRRRRVERSLDARVELHHVVEQRQLEDPPHVRVVDDDPQLGAVRTRPPRRARAGRRASSSR